MDANPVPLDIVRAGTAGQCIAYFDGATVFVSSALPGERVLARIVRRRRGICEAEVTEVLEASPARVRDRRLDWKMPELGGVAFAHVDADTALELKSQGISEQFSRLAKIDSFAGLEAVPSAVDETGAPAYRTRVQLGVDRDGHVGLRAARSHAVTALPAGGPIPLACPEISQLGLHRLHLPGLERLDVAWSPTGGAFIVRGAGEPLEQAVAQCTELLQTWTGEWSIVAASSARPEQKHRGRKRSHQRPGPVRQVLGAGTVSERVSGVQRAYRVQADGFWQVHTHAPTTLVAAVTEAVGSANTVGDLYCGSGLFAVALAEMGAAVWGLEANQAAVDDARANAAGLDAEFQVTRLHAAIDLPAAEALVLDPPRAGITPELVDSLAASSAHTVAYVSCDAGTLARDAARLLACGFSLRSLRGFDMFPLTGHAELIAVFNR